MTVKNPYLQKLLSAPQVDAVHGGVVFSVGNDWAFTVRPAAGAEHRYTIEGPFLDILSPAATIEVQDTVDDLLELLDLPEFGLGVTS